MMIIDDDYWWLLMIIDVYFIMCSSLKDIAILSAKENTYRCILMDSSKNEGLKRLNNSVTYDRGVL